MKKFEEKERQIQDICDRLKNANLVDVELKNAYCDIMKIVRQAYREGHKDGMLTYADIQNKSQDIINNLLKN